MSTLAPGASITVTAAYGGEIAISTNGGLAQVVATPVAGVARTAHLGPVPVRRIFGPYPLGAQLTITNINCNSFIYDSPGDGVGPIPTRPGQPAKPVLTAMAGAVSVAWTPGAAGSTATTSNIWTDINGNVTQLTTNPQVITAPAGTPYTGTVATVNAQGAGPASEQADAVTPLAGIVSWLYKDIIVGSSQFAAQVGMNDAGRQSILFHNPTPYVLQYNMANELNNVFNQPNGTWVDIPANSQVFVTDSGKPYARGKAFAITGITSDGTTATVTTAAAHNLTTGASVRVQDVTPSGYNGAFPSITVTGANTFTYPLATALANTTVPGTWAGRPLTGFTAQTKAIK